MLPGSSFFSDDPGYDDDFPQMRGAAECQHYETPSMTSRGDVPAIGRLIWTGFAGAAHTLRKFSREQSDGGLPAYRLIKGLSHNKLRTILALGCTGGIK